MATGDAETGVEVEGLLDGVGGEGGGGGTDVMEEGGEEGGEVFDIEIGV